MNLNIEEILKCTGGKLICGDTKYECENFSRDTRTINKNDTYIGIKGINFDGLSYWKEAFDKGASTVIINKTNIDDDLEKYKGKNIIQVEDTIIALGKMAKYKREKYGKNLTVVGVTGSVGKTSTKDILHSVISQKYKALKTEGNCNNYIGLPLTILRLKDEEVAVIEMGMNHLGEIDYLSKIAKPDISVITNIGTSHIGNLGSRENILKAKLEIINGMEKPVLVLNNDNDLLNKWVSENNEQFDIHTYGIDEKSDINATNVVLNENNSEFDCEYENEKIKINVPVAGKHFILNSLCAFTVGKLLNINNNEIINGIKSVTLTSKRMEIIKTNKNITIVNDSYNASYESMKASITTLKNMAGKRKIAILGDMFELGDFSEKLHRDVGKEIFENNIDELFLIGDYAKYIGIQAEEDGYPKEKITKFENKENLINNVKKELKDGDVVLVKASNGMRLFDVANELIKFFNR